ncbi:MAG TPA: prolyl oligopeptidase family serine peptidase, partial [Acidobacteriaceae bacterium]|nr:prolyl oligopeptidase family serine peptidase [Acidobacteriaceae bacterium]
MISTHSERIFSLLQTTIFCTAIACLGIPNMATMASAQDTTKPAASPAATKQIASILQQLGRTHWLQQAAISPNGTTVAWVARLGRTGSRIHLSGLGGMSSGSIVTASNATSPTYCSEDSVAWSPDSKQIAFLSDCQSGDQSSNQPQLFVAAADGSTAPRQLTNATGYMQQVAWSPNGKQIAFLFVENATRVTGALAAMKPAEGVISAANLAEVQRVAIVNVASGAMHIATPANLHVYEYDWAPNSNALAYIAAPPPGEDNWWVAELYTQANPNARPQAILKPNMQIALPRWSPDGQQIAFIGGLMSDQGITGGDIYLMAATGGTPRDVTPDRASSPAWIHWLNGSTILFTEFVDGHSRIAQLNTQTGAATNLWQGGESIDPGSFGLGISVSATSNANATNAGLGTLQTALVRSSWAMAPDVWAGKIGQWQRITYLNAGQKPDWGEAKSLTWTNEGYHSQGWLLYPKNYDASKKYPLIVSVHGGPANVVLPRWPYVGYNATAFSSLGYFVLFPNPRGSYGAGERFTAANRKDFGYGDLRDILAGVDLVTKTLPIDPNRVGITGWSYGGFMTMFAVTQTQRFRAAVAGAGISDWKSYYGENSIDQWMLPYFGASVYDDPAVYAKSSAINFIRKAKTPTLVVVGDRDGECPAPQSFEFWHALR